MLATPVHDGYRYLQLFHMHGPSLSLFAWKPEASHVVIFTDDYFTLCKALRLGRGPIQDQVPWLSFYHFNTQILLWECLGPFRNIHLLDLCGKHGATDVLRNLRIHSMAYCLGQSPIG